MVGLRPSRRTAVARALAIPNTIRRRAVVGHTVAWWLRSLRAVARGSRHEPAPSNALAGTSRGRATKIAA